MLPHILAEKRWQLLVLLGITGTLQSASLLWLINSARLYVESGDIPNLSSSIFILLCILLLASGRYLERYKAEQLAQDYIYRLRELIYSKAQQLPGDELRIAGKGATLMRLTGDLTAVRNWIIQGLAPLIVIGLWCIVSLGVLMQLHWLLVVALLIPLTIACCGNYLMGRLLFKRAEKTRRVRGKMIRNMTEKLRHLHLIRAFNQSGKENRLFLRQARKLRSSQMKRSHTSALMRGMNEFLLLFSILALVCAALWLNTQGQLGGELMAVMMTGALYLLSQLRRLTRLYEYWTLYTVARKKLTCFIARESRAEGRQKRLSQPFSMQLHQIRVRSRLKRQSFNITDKARILLTGESGSGKSTLLSIIAGQTETHGGRVELCGRKLGRYRSSLISQQICLISPALPLLRGSVKDNLFYGARHSDEAYTQNILKLCGLDRTEKLPRGLESQVTEDGLNLSANLRFRIVLARALLRQPALILIDEDAAMSSPEIRTIIGNISHAFSGAMIICSTSTDYNELCNETWALSPTRETDPHHRPDNVVELEHYAKRP